MEKTSPDIVLINPPYDQIDPESRYVRHVTNRAPSLGLLQLAASVRSHGFQPMIIEGDLEDFTEEQIIERVLQSGAGVVGLTLFTVGVHNGMSIAAGLKERNPAIRIVVGGPHISSMGRATMERFAQVDVAVQKEGDHTLPAVLNAWEASTDLHRIKGLFLRNEDNSIVFTGESEEITELDNLPDPAWDLLPNFPHGYPAAIFNYPRGPVATMATSRGCPHSCNFCDNSVFGKRIRAMSPERIFSQMKRLYYDYGVRHIFFVDDLFVFSRRHMDRLSTMLIQERMDLTWNCAARVEILNPKLLEKMKRAGCWEISFGLESGSDKMLQQMNKHETTEQAERVVRWTADSGIRAKGLFMLGYPGEDLNTIQETKGYIQRLPLSVLNLTRFTPYPGSRIYRDIFHSNIKEEHWDSMNGMNFIHIDFLKDSHNTIDRDTLDQFYAHILKTFYRQNRIVHSYIKMGVKNPEHIYRLFRFLLAFLATRIKKISSDRTLSNRATSM